MCKGSFCSPDVVQRRIHQKPESEILKGFEQSMKQICSRLRKMRYLFHRLTVAIDFTDKLYYGDKNDLGVIATRYQRGTKYCFRYITLSIVIGDTQDYKAYCLGRFAVNGNVGRFNVLNNFVGKFLGRKELLIGAPDSEPTNKKVLSREELERFIAVAQTPLEKMVVLLQVEGLLRSSEICELKASNIDFENRKLYLDDTKTGNNYIIMSKLLTATIKEYQKHRVTSKQEEEEDRLIIIDKSNYKGLAPARGRTDFVYNLTKRLSVRAEIRRKVYPYLIKPSAITNYFNENVNPKTIQRMAR